jgi:hypothetical protein
MATGQRQRKKKTSAGLHGGGGKGRRLTMVEKINMGGGLYRNINRPNFGRKIVEEKK